MHIMVRFVGLVSVIMILLAVSPVWSASNTLTKEELADGWILLFDGETTYGWKASNNADWTVADGVISVSSGEKGLLCTTSEFADYVLKVDFRAGLETNSGVFLRTPAQPKDPRSDCYELNIADAAISPFPTGSFVGRQRCEAYRPNSEWQTFEAQIRGGRSTVKLDGRQVLD